MKTVSKIENLFAVINETADLIAKECQLSYIEAVAETGENIFHGSILQEDLSEITVKSIKRKYESVKIDTFEKEELRKAYQLAILKGLKEGAHPNHQMTPDTIGLFLGYLVSKFVGSQNEISVLDPAVGTGNLLTTILNYLASKQVESYGVDVDDLLIKLSYINANLQEHPVKFFNQDSLERLFIDPVDVVVCDLPVGYYPNDIEASKYELKADEGHSYSHHLFIEQSIKHAKENGYLFFIVPNSLFETKEAPKLNRYLREVAIIQGFIQLPISLFKHEKHGKSILVLQKKGENSIPPKQALLVDLPKFSDKVAMSSIMKKIDQWFKENK
ncbi:class I SAM-dependent methyltransferase [Metabacillus litoralis]|jgi:site-specific DNA-methyltransferase (adenine-specific)|uniref:class I SAM-dependent methyltransferase n=1 Tax=Metabacillus litoralis TaxID=152268 RepID=UPI002040C9F4|nr:class I SAM-dependent methyltransferase [Metabacillus litoralis]MCM3650743.1 class I SAM-dependent methyltransferase [Metabacillus litoralis]